MEIVPNASAAGSFIGAQVKNLPWHILCIRVILAKVQSRYRSLE